MEEECQRYNPITSVKWNKCQRKKALATTETQPEKSICHSEFSRLR